MEVADVLTVAKAIVSQGWHKGSYTDGHGNYCLRGAICLAAGDMRVRDGEVVYCGGLSEARLATEACAAVAAVLPEPFQSIPVFNDYGATTAWDVLAVLDKALSEVSCGR